MRAVLSDSDMRSAVRMRSHVQVGGEVVKRFVDGIKLHIMSWIEGRFVKTIRVFCVMKHCNHPGRVVWRMR